MPARQDVTERVERNSNEMKEKGCDLDRIASELEVVKRTLEDLEIGTADGTEQVEQSIAQAENVTRDVFVREDEHLERTQLENEDFEGNLQELRGSSETGLGRISDTSAKIETSETVNELINAKEVILRDIDFLAEQIDRAREARADSNAIQERLRARIQAMKE